MNPLSARTRHAVSRRLAAASFLALALLPLPAEAQLCNPTKIGGLRVEMVPRNFNPLGPGGACLGFHCDRPAIGAPVPTVTFDAQSSTYTVELRANVDMLGNIASTGFLSIARDVGIWFEGAQAIHPYDPPALGGTCPVVSLCGGIPFGATIDFDQGWAILRLGGLTCNNLESHPQVGQYTLDLYGCKLNNGCPENRRQQTFDLSVVNVANLLGCPQPKTFTCPGDAQCELCKGPNSSASAAGGGPGFILPNSTPAAPLSFATGGVGFPGQPGSTRRAVGDGLGQGWSNAYFQYIRPDATKIRLSYNTDGFPTRMTLVGTDLSERIEAAWDYDTEGNVIASWRGAADPFDPGAVDVWRFAFDDPVLPEVTTVTDPLGNDSTYTLERETTWEYSPTFPALMTELEQPSTTGNPLEFRRTTIGYDGTGNPISRTIEGLEDNLPFSYTTTTTFTTEGQADTIDPPGYGTNDQTSWTYDAARGGLVPETRTDPIIGTTAFTYDAFNRRATVTDVNGVVTETLYDALDKVRFVIQHGATPAEDLVTENVYNSFGDLFQTILPKGNVIEYGYDGAGRLISIERKPEASPASHGERTFYTLDTFGHRIREELQMWDGMVWVSASATDYQYSTRCHLDKVTTGAGSASESTTEYS